MSRAAGLLGPGGPLSAHLSGYEARRGQLAMAAAVERTLSEDRVLVCEAGTGTGKTLAYLVPAVLSGKKVVVSTATRALQEQIVRHDLPLLHDGLGLEPRAAVMKGLANYLCRRRFRELLGSVASKRRTPASVGAIEDWVATTQTGDVAELTALPESDPVLGAVTSSTDTRLGARCRDYERCFVTRMKREAADARLVVVNHHLFFADLALRGAHPGHVIPDYDAVVFDEAHRLEDIATTFFGTRVSKRRLDLLLADAGRALAAARLRGARSAKPVERTREATRRFFGALAGACAGEGRTMLERESWAGEPERRWHDLDSALEGLGALAESTHPRLREDERGRPSPTPSSPADALEQIARRIRDVRDDIASVVDGGPGRITWFDAGATPALSSSQVDVGDLLRERIFETIPAVVLTSATLASVSPEGPAGTGFEFFRARVGIADDAVQVDELVVPSPFDFPSRSLLYAPRDLPSPRDGGFLDVAAERIAQLVRVTDGGAFVLTTSLRSMRALRAALSHLLAPRPVLVQGDAPKGALLDRFRSHGSAVLVATMSFWEGVDVPGSALRLVVLEKVPFAPPTDPLPRARAAAVEAQGGNAFMDYHVPSAAIALKQGFGRLIRTATDRGVVALLDGRVHRRGYGKRLLAALPPAPQVETMEEVREFWTRTADLPA